MSIELLAPAGSREAVSAAVQNGADAIYLGLQSFGARQFAKNFDMEALRETVRYCHLRGVQVHVAMNTLIYEQELASALALAQDAVRSGVDALIVQDLGFAGVLAEQKIPVPVHASTQMTIHNKEGAEFARSTGFSRVVLARELPRKEIETIAKEVDIETEVFIHGALCMSYSGQCLMSSMLGGRSGNRGRCAQPCRLPYTMLENGSEIGKGYFMSPKDLCLGARIPELISMGITSLKIEGRMKSAAYVAAATRAYRNCIDENRSMTPEEMQQLQKVFSRDDFTEGFYAGKTGRGMMKVQSSNDDIYQKQDAALLRSLEKTYAQGMERRHREIVLCIRVRAGERLTASACSSSAEVFCEGVVVEKAQGNPVTEDMIKTQLGKLGGSNFSLQRLDIELEDGVFVPKSALNAVRRELIEKLEQQLTVNKHQNWTAVYAEPSHRDHVAGNMAITAWVENLQQARALMSQPVSRIYIPAGCIDEIEPTENVVAAFPAIMRETAMKKAKEQLAYCLQLGVKRIATGNIGLLQWAKNFELSLYGTSDLNIGNAAAAAFWERFGLVGVEASRELNLRRLSDLTKYSAIPVETIGYGKVELMKLENCLINISKKGCHCKKESYYELLDRKNARMRVAPSGCVSSVFNSVPVYMADRLPELSRSGAASVKLVFTDEAPEQCVQIVQAFRQGNGTPPHQYTRGHYYRGAE